MNPGSPGASAVLPAATNTGAVGSNTRTSKASTFVSTTSSPCRWEVLKIRPSGGNAAW